MTVFTMDKLGTTLIVSYTIYFYQKLLQLTSRAVLYCTVEARFTTASNGESSAYCQQPKLLEKYYATLSVFL
ncbi:hypothetical protein [Nostoc sp. FACHB-888]|uniref:hypothetical protein n=1 Tax=Nostoc sp. FACHB-888 TaxID=2692842 RepID=UPI001684BA78|nr:hypothetical protein [Nostoc sp. FACHB-888]MBD2248750.1 hypothetical protein [Nostoc sp. FACHB-888]